MNFDPNAATGDVLPEGEYDAEIVKYEEGYTKTDNSPMLTLGFKLYASKGEGYSVDRIIFPRFQWKLKKLCEALGLSAKYESGKIGESDLKGKALRVAVIVEEDKTGQYPDKNSIRKYLAIGVASKKAATPVGAAVATDDLDIPEESIPF